MMGWPGPPDIWPHALFLATNSKCGLRAYDSGAHIRPHTFGLRLGVAVCCDFGAWVGLSTCRVTRHETLEREKPWEIGEQF